VHIDPAELNRNDGFSPGQVIMTRVPGLDLKRSKAVSVADLGRYAARRAPIVLLDARTRERQPIWAELDEQASGDEVTLLIHPSRNLRDGQRYIVALRNLSDSAGRTLRPGAAFRAIRDGRAATGPLAARARQLEPSLRTLDAAGIGRSSLYLAWDFTVASTRNLTGRMLAIRDDAFAQLGDRDLADLNAISILQDLSKFPSLADRLQQGMLNGLYLGRLMLHPQGLAAEPAFKGLLDTSRLYSDGNSQGGIFGGGFAAVAPDYTRAVLGVPGMNYSLLLPRSVDFDTYNAILKPAYPSALDRTMGIGMIQGLWDRGEGNGYANHITRDPLPQTPRKTILLEVALGDHQVSQIAAEVEARTIGARAHRPIFGPGRTWEKDPFFQIRTLRANDPGSGIVVWDSGSPVPPRGNVPPRAGRDPHEDPRATPANRLQKSRFLAPGGVVSDVCGGAPCRAIQTD
jgi:hypothetical protein